MKTKILSTVLFTCVALSMTAQSSKVKLSDESKEEKIEVKFLYKDGTAPIHYCDIILTKKKTDDDGNTTVNVEIENINETWIILLFRQHYSEKDLKKLKPKIYLGKDVSGDRGKRDLIVCPELK